MQSFSNSIPAPVLPSLCMLPPTESTKVDFSMYPTTTCAGAMFEATVGLSAALSVSILIMCVLGVVGVVLSIILVIKFKRCKEG